MDFDRSEIEGTIPARFRRLADALPDYPAVRRAGAHITFSDLDSESDRVAGNLLALRGPDSEPVAILLVPGIVALTAMLGCLKAGKMFTLLSPDVEPRQLAALWENTLRPLILTDGDHRPLAESIAVSGGPILDVNQPAQAAFDPSRVHTTPDTPAMLTYSSGTTSAPKGAVNTHRMILHSSWFYNHVHDYSVQDRITYLGAYSSAHAMSYNLYTILCGANLVLPPEGHKGSFPYIEWLQREKITVLSITALGLLQQHLRACPEKPPLPDLRELTIGGQELSRPELEELRRFFPPAVTFIFRMASSDVNQISELRIRPYSEIPWEKLPVGEAVPGKEILLLGEDHQPVPFGEDGEIAVRSKYLPPGYWRQPELTAERFLPDPDGGDRRIFLTGDKGRFLPNGFLEFRGRKDNLVRIQNQNVQLEEVEKCLLQTPGIREAVAQVAPWTRGEKRLTAYIVPAQGAELTVDSIRRCLDDLLAPHMIPSLYVFVDSLPRLSTGKVNRSALPAPAETRPRLSTPYLQPRTEMESKLCSLWSELLHITPIGVNDDFYHLGGDSLLVLTMSLTVEENFHRAIPPAYYRKVTIASLADIWGRQDGAAPATRVDADDAGHSVSGQDITAHRAQPSPRPAGRRRRQMPSAKSNRGVSFASSLAMQLPYLPGCRWVAFFCRLYPARRFFLQPHIQLFREFRASLGGCPAAPADAEWISLAGNILWSANARAGLGDLADQNSLEGMRASPSRFWRDLAGIVDRAPQSRFDRIFQVDGWEHLEQAFAAGRGVILVSFHSTSNRAASCAIYRRLRSEPIQTLSANRALRIENLRRQETPSETSRPSDVTLVSDLLMQGYQALKSGQIIQIVPDGRDFSVQDEPLLVGGRKTYIQSGFAKLALTTDAVIIPVSTTRRLDGSIHSTFSGPLVPRDAHSPIEEKILDLVAQYANFLESSWRASPESVKWSKMEKHLRRATEL
jgi:acyl-CoA synthetase (AMP-forming)/AMP-acid ligase II/lauroyl/myristoyl acyltransferase